jgi:hypothetical protein
MIISGQMKNWMALQPVIRVLSSDSKKRANFGISVDPMPKEIILKGGGVLNGYNFFEKVA